MNASAAIKLLQQQLHTVPLHQELASEIRVVEGKIACEVVRHHAWRAVGVVADLLGFEASENQLGKVVNLLWLCCVNRPGNRGGPLV